MIVFPELDALPLSGEEWNPVVEEHLGRVGRLSSTPLSAQHVTLVPWQENHVDARSLEFQVHRADHLHYGLLVEAPECHPVATTDFRGRTLQNREHSAGLIELDLDEAGLLGFWRHV